MLRRPSAAGARSPAATRWPVAPTWRKLREAGPLHRLSGLGDREGLPARDLLQPLVELGRGVHRVEDLVRGAPPLRRTLLEQSQRIAVAVGQVPQSALLQGRRQGHDLPTGRNVHRDAGGLDRLGVGHLLRRITQSRHGDRFLSAAVQDRLHLSGDGRGIHRRCTACRAGGRSRPSAEGEDRNRQQ